MDEATWAALAATLTLLGLAWTWVAYRRRGIPSGMRALGFTTLPAAAWLTGTLEMFTEIAGSVTDWATGVVLNPITWTGIGLAGFGVLLIVLGGFLRDRQLAAGAPAAVSRSKRRRALPKGESDAGGDPAMDADLAEIEALLKRRGIE